MANSAATDTYDCLCEKCKNIFLQEGEPEDGKLYPHHPDRDHLNTAAASGCTMCLALLREVTSHLTKSHDALSTLNLSKWSITAELGDDNPECYEVTLYYLTFVELPSGTETPSQSPQPVSVSKVHFWLQPDKGLYAFYKGCAHPLR
jgi:hypothetical protein